jgi:hypothetical protein
MASAKSSGGDDAEEDYNDDEAMPPKKNNAAPATNNGSFGILVAGEGGAAASSSPSSFSPTSSTGAEVNVDVGMGVVLSTLIGEAGGGTSTSTSARNGTNARRITMGSMYRDGSNDDYSYNDGGGGVDAREARDDYVRSAARFRSLVGSALRRVADGFNTGGVGGTARTGTGSGASPSSSSQMSAGTKRSRGVADDDGDDDDNSSGASLYSPGGSGGGRAGSRRRLGGKHSNNDYAADLAREKAAEVLVLQRVRLASIYVFAS